VSTSEISALFKQVQSFAIGGDALATDNALIGSRLRVGITSRGLSRRDLCRQLDIKSADLDAYESGKERISARLLLRIAKLLDVRPDYFFRAYAEEASKAA
jgi:transcriptional regulator with XRE-family HTH domain